MNPDLISDPAFRALLTWLYKVSSNSMRFAADLDTRTGRSNRKLSRDAVATGDISRTEGMSPLQALEFWNTGFFGTPKQNVLSAVGYGNRGPIGK